VCTGATQDVAFVHRKSVAERSTSRDRSGVEAQAQAEWSVRRAEPGDYEQIGALFEAVAAEARWIGAELPIDHDSRRARFLAGLSRPDAVASLVAVTVGGGRIIGDLGIEKAPHGVADLGMLVDDEWRGRGVGSGLLEAAIAWARSAGAHKVALQMWPHNERARGLYEKFGFVEEGRLVRHYRRRNGELWDAVVMGLALD
jgi:RimJ/RimL family protein N-acetyltransferase